MDRQGLSEIGKDGPLASMVRAGAEAIKAIAQATAPRGRERGKNHRHYQDSFTVEDYKGGTDDRARSRVVNDVPHWPIVQARSRNLTRAANAAGRISR